MINLPSHWWLHFTLLLSVFLLLSCKSTPAARSGPLSNSDLIIDDSSFYGIGVGRQISDLPKDRIAATSRSNGEGSFKIFAIQDNAGVELGHFYPDPNNQLRVGTIVITTSAAQTTEGLRIGSTYDEIMQKVREFMVHGSEIEARTHVYFRNFALRLDHLSTEWELDPASIPPHSRVTQILIRQRQ